MTVISENLKNS